MNNEIPQNTDPTTVEVQVPQRIWKSARRLRDSDDFRRIGCGCSTLFFGASAVMGTIAGAYAMSGNYDLRNPSTWVVTAAGAASAIGGVSFGVWGLRQREYTSEKK